MEDDQIKTSVNNCMNMNGEENKNQDLADDRDIQEMKDLRFLQAIQQSLHGNDPQTSSKMERFAREDT